MATRTPRMAQIEELLADDPNDAFLRYGLAMEYAGAGEAASAAEQLISLAGASSYVPAFLQAGQILARLNRFDEARSILRDGIAAAKKQGDAHAEGEMTGLLAGLE